MISFHKNIPLSNSKRISKTPQFWIILLYFLLVYLQIGIGTLRGSRLYCKTNVSNSTKLINRIMPETLFISSYYDEDKDNK